MRFGLLLAAITIVFVVQGVATPGRWEEVILAALLAATVLLSLRVADAQPRVLWPAALLALVIVLFSLVEAIEGHEHGTAVRLANMFLVTIAPPAIAIGIVRTLRRRDRVTIEAVLGVLSLYLMIGMFFAALYGLIGHLDSNGFFVQNVATTSARCLYFSFTTLTTVGYGDLTAASNLGHTLSVSEALLGQIYLVTVVSLIVANLGRSRTSAEIDASEQAR